jgi:hypothetical protein
MTDTHSSRPGAPRQHSRLPVGARYLALHARETSELDVRSTTLESNQA